MTPGGRRQQDPGQTPQVAQPGALSNEGNGHGYRQDFRGCGSGVAEGRAGDGEKLRSVEERRSSIETAFCMVGKVVQVSNSGAGIVAL